MSERYELIRREEGNYPVASMCELVGVSKSGYYNWLSRPEAATKVRRRKLALLVESEFKASDMILRVPAPRRRPEAQGHRRVPRHASAPLMREKGLKAAQPRRKVRTTTPRRATSTPAPTWWTGTPAAEAPGLKWVGDITYIRTWVGFVYLATVLDCCTKKVVGYAMADNMKTDLICKATGYGRAPLPPPGGGHDLPHAAGAVSTPHSNSPNI